MGVGTSRANFRRASWRNSRLILVAIVAGLLWCGFSAGSAFYRRYGNTQAAWRQTALSVDVNIPGAEAGRAYTVVTKFRVQDRPYESAPVQIHFAAKQSSYPLTLYYDGKNPAKNSWAKFEGNDLKNLQRAKNFGIGFLLLGVLLVGWVKPWSVQE